MNLHYSDQILDESLFAEFKELWTEAEELREAND